LTEEIKTRQTAEETTNAVQSCQRGHKVDTRSDTERATLEFNRYLYENLISNVECQIEYWNRKADCQSNSQASQALRLKAEGLGYALRLLNAFEPEFRELVDCASRAATDGMVQP
jgi:hypothetical protein